MVPAAASVEIDQVLALTVSASSALANVKCPSEAVCFFIAGGIFGGHQLVRAAADAAAQLQRRFVGIERGQFGVAPGQHRRCHGGAGHVFVIRRVGGNGYGGRIRIEGHSARRGACRQRNLFGGRQGRCSRIDARELTVLFPHGVIADFVGGILVIGIECADARNAHHAVHRRSTRRRGRLGNADRREAIGSGDRFALEGIGVGQDIWTR